MLLAAKPVGYLIIISCILIFAIPVAIIKVFSKHSKHVAGKNYLEAEILSLNQSLYWHKDKISTLEASLDHRVIFRQKSTPHVVAVQNVVTQQEPFMNVDESQVEMDFDVITNGSSEATEPFVHSFNPPKMTQLTLADQPDVLFLDRLNLKNSNVIPFPIEVKHETAFEEELSIEQMEFTLAVEAMEHYQWTKGTHFVHLSIKDHYGEDLALCEIKGRVGTTMIQHAKISALKDGDTFAASIFVDSTGIKVVDKLWSDLVQDFAWSAEG